MRKTKIICTIGPACRDKETLKQMCLAGMNVARLNFSHGTHEEHLYNINLVKAVREELNLPIAIMLDTKGPEYRIKTFKDKKVTLTDGQRFILTTEDCVGDETRVAVNYTGLTSDLSVGDRVLINNGLVTMVVEKIEGKDVHCLVENGGELSDRKSMNFPNKTLNGVYLSEQDKTDILFGVQNGVDFIAASFVSTESDIYSLRKFLDDNRAYEVEIIAKIENRAGVDNIDDICKYADGVMVARGDLGVEIPYIEVPVIQKHLISKCRMLGKRVITATEMLESMINNTRPTRAEISDVANAVYDGSSAVMLSGETAAGKHPVQAVKCMAEIAENTEKNIEFAERFKVASYKIRNVQDAISHATCQMAIDVKAKCIVVNSLSGGTARMISRFRCPADIIGITTDTRAWRRLNLSWGVIPVLTEPYDSLEVLFYQAMQKAKTVFDLNSGDNVVLTGGKTTGTVGNTNTIRVETVK